jgi:hypothetical protein
MIDPTLVSLISAATALVASIAGPAATLYIGRAQFRAAVLSANRQKWIDSFRDTVAAFCSQVAVAVQMRDVIIKEGRLTLTGDSVMLREFEQLIFTFTKIRLMINPAEEHHGKLLDAMQALLVDIRSAPPSVDMSEAAELAVGRIVAMSQAMVRQEWLRVKRGA